MSREPSTQNQSNRRNFLKGTAAAGVALASAGVIVSNLTNPRTSVKAASLSDIDILNFALNLEYLEAEFYSMAVTGKTLLQNGSLSSGQEQGPTTGGKQVAQLVNGSPTLYVAQDLRINELSHVSLLRAALGSNAAKKPAINLDALGYGFGSLAEFTKLARQLEDVGTSAYLGAVPLITNLEYLATAGAILTTEAKHSGTLRYQCIACGVPSPAVDSIDIPPSKTNLYGTDSNGLVPSRTTSQVLNVVYGGGTCSGGFYPNGMTGTVTCQGS